MPALTMTPDRLAFGDFVLDATSRQVRRRDGALVPLTPRLFNALHLFVMRAGELLDKNELMRNLWPGLVVEENNLSQLVLGLRRALGDDVKGNRYIQTVPRRGFRFVARVVAEPGGVGAVDGAETVPIAHGVAAPRATLAVLPFVCLTPDGQLDLLEVGMADSLILRLSAVPGLVVRSIGSVARFANRDRDPLQSGQLLDAAWVVDGSLQHSGDRLRVSARLLSVPGGAAAWSGSFNESFVDVFDIQDLIAERVAQAMAGHFRSVVPSANGLPAIHIGDTRNIDAYQLYMAANQQAQSVRSDGLLKSIDLFRKALVIDPGYALAHTGIAESYRRMIFGADLPPQDVFEPSRREVLRALEMVPDLAAGHAQLAWIHYWYDYDWAEAERVYRQALTRNPNLVGAHFGLGFMLVTLGRTAEGLEHVRTARELDPMSMLINTMEATFLADSGDRTAGVARLSHILEIEPRFWIAHMAMAKIHLAADELGEAVAALRRSDELADRSTQPAALLGAALARNGQVDEARAVLDRLLSLAQTRYVPATSLACIHAGLGDAQLALDALERAFDLRDTRLIYLKDDRRWDTLRGEPRFAALLHRLKLDRYGPGLNGP